MPKSVTFDTKVRVSLINTRAECYDITGQIWWSQKELASIRNRIIFETKSMMLQHPEKTFMMCQKEILRKSI